MSDFTDKLAKIRQEKGLSRRALGDLLDTPEAKIQKIEIGTQRADHEFLANLSNKLDISLDWLLGKGSPKLPATSDATFVSLPVYNIEASAGGGSLIDQEMKVADWQCTDEWLKDNSIRAKDAILITVAGDSMEPELTDGDLILVDKSRTDYKRGGVYVVYFSGDTYVKRVHRVGGHKMRLMSSNKLYDPIDIDLRETPDFTINGRVMASIHRWNK